MCTMSKSGVCCGKHGCRCCRERRFPPEYPVAEEFYDIQEAPESMPYDLDNNSERKE